MSRFNLAITIIVANAALNNAFLPARIAASSRSFAPFKARSYLDSLSQQPKSEESTLINVEDSLSTMQEEIAELKELTQPKEDEVVQQLSKEETPKEDATDAVAVAAIDVELDPAAETLVKEVEKVSIETLVADPADSIAAINMELDQLEYEAATAAVAAVAVIQEESKPEPDETAEEPCDDEKISFTIAAAAASTLGVNTSRNYRTTRQTLRESRGKNEKRLSRSTYEKEKSSDKILAIRAKADEQIKIVERDLEGKLVDIQGSFDSEVSQSGQSSQQRNTCMFSCSLLVSCCCSFLVLQILFAHTSFLL